MEITPAMRAHRNLRRAKHYRSFAGHEVEPSVAVRYPLAEGESLIGVYENIPDSLDHCLVITDRALHMRAESKWVDLPYGEMESVDVEGGDKLADHLEIRLRDDSKVLVPVLGEEEMGKDTYLMLMFLGHVIGDRRRLARDDDDGLSSRNPHTSPVTGEPAAR